MHKLYNTNILCGPDLPVPGRRDRPYPDAGSVAGGDRRRKASFIGAVLIIAIGVFIFVSMLDTMENLNGQIRQYYARSELADVFAEVEGISPEQLSRLEEIPGVRKASGRLAEDVRAPWPAVFLQSFSAGSCSISKSG